MMGCDISLFSTDYFRSSSGRKRLSSDSDGVKSESSATSSSESPTAMERSRLLNTGPLNRLRELFTRNGKGYEKQTIQPTLPDNKIQEVNCSLEEATHLAVKNRDVDELLKLISQSGDGFAISHGSLGARRLNPVEFACSLGHYDMVETLLENGCSPNLPTIEGKLLHTVLESLKSHPENIVEGRRVIKYLIDNCCDLDIKDRSSTTPLFLCSQIGDGEVMKMILERCSTKQLYCPCSTNQFIPLHMSAMRGDYECVRLLLKYKPHKQVKRKILTMK